MRNAGTLGLILNAPLFDGMQFKLTGEKTVMFGAIDPDNQKIVSYALRFDNPNLAMEAMECFPAASNKELRAQFLQDTNGGDYERHLREFEQQQQQQQDSSQTDSFNNQEEEYDGYGSDDAGEDLSGSDS